MLHKITLHSALCTLNLFAALLCLSPGMLCHAQQPALQAYLNTRYNNWNVNSSGGYHPALVFVYHTITYPTTANDGYVIVWLIAGYRKNQRPSHSLVPRP